MKSTKAPEFNALLTGLNIIYHYTPGDTRISYYLGSMRIYLSRRLCDNDIDILISMGWQSDITQLAWQFPVTTFDVRSVEPK